MDGADPVVPAEQEREFLHGGQLVVGDEDVNHGPEYCRRQSTIAAARFRQRASGIMAGLGLGDPHGDQGAFARGRSR